ncbi:MAG: hypothetical protein SFZ02_18925 [bacterium]|nr:hypothetical protein [bacterium]
MSVWDNLSGRSVTSEQKAYLEAMLIIIMADGKLEQDEFRQLFMLCNGFDVFEGLSDKTIIGSLEESYQRFGRINSQARIGEVAQVLQSKQQRMEALYMARVVANANGVNKIEDQLTIQMKQIFGLSDAEYQRVLDGDIY